jgi:hypothetical protein
VARVAAEGLGQERLDQAERGRLVVHPRTDADQVGVVVLTGQLGGLDAVGQGAAGAADLVGRDLLAVARAPDHHAQAARVGDGRLGGGEAERRVVVDGVVRCRPVVDGLVPEVGETAPQRLLQLEAGVVRTEMDAHGRT